MRIDAVAGTTPAPRSGGLGPHRQRTDAPAAQPAVEIRELVFAYRRGLRVLDIPELVVPRGERVFLHGPSGSGKTTLLGIVSGVLPVAPGTVRALGQDLGRMSGGRRDRYRAVHVGYIFQMFNLIPYLSVLDNITLSCRMSGERRRRVGEDLEGAARDMAGRLGILDQSSKKVTELSVGQQQRVAAARALLGKPEIVIAEAGGFEPVGGVDAIMAGSWPGGLLESVA